MQELDVVADTSPLLNLALIDEHQLLEKQFGKVKVPEQVWSELEEGEKGLKELEDLVDRNVIEIIEVPESSLFRELRDELDLGESAALSHSIEEGIDLVLLDEKEARQVARRHSIDTTGVIGILLKEYRNEEEELRTSLEKLREKGFWISDQLLDKILEQ